MASSPSNNSKPGKAAKSKTKGKNNFVGKGQTLGDLVAEYTPIVSSAQSTPRKKKADRADERARYGDLDHIAGTLMPATDYGLPDDDYSFAAHDVDGVLEDGAWEEEDEDGNITVHATGGPSSEDVEAVLRKDASKQLWRNALRGKMRLAKVITKYELAPSGNTDEATYPGAYDQVIDADIEDEQTAWVPDNENGTHLQVQTANGRIRMRKITKVDIRRMMLDGFEAIAEDQKESEAMAYKKTRSGKKFGGDIAE